MPGWLNVDRQSRIEPDAVVDLSKFPWPWADDSIDAIYSSHLLEHLPDTLATMRECHRILKVGGTMEAVVPFAATITYFSDPTHCRPWTDQTVEYFIKGHPSCIYGDFGFTLLFNRLLSSGMNAPQKAQVTIRRVLRNLIPFRGQLKHMIMGMYDEVHFKLLKQ